MEIYGLRPHTANAFRYIKSYYKEPLRGVLTAISDIEAVLKLIGLARSRVEVEKVPVQRC